MPKVPPKNLDLFTMRFPLPAIASILHRLSGFVLFLLLPAFLWVLQRSLTADGFSSLQAGLSDGRVKGLVWLLLAPLVYHLLAGIRHLLADAGVATSRVGGKCSAAILFAVFLVIMASLGVALW